MIKVDVTPVPWGIVNQTQLGIFTSVTCYIPAFLFHSFITLLCRLIANHIPINNKLSTNVWTCMTCAAWSNQELEELASNLKTGWHHWAVRTITLLSPKRFRGTGPILVGTNPPIPFVVALILILLMISLILPCWCVIPVCWLIIECSAIQSPVWQIMVFEVKYCVTL